jgi:phosphoribosylformylglycinamidine synthase
MIWEIEVRPLGRNALRDQAIADFQLLTHRSDGDTIFTAASHGYLLEGQVTEHDIRLLAERLLADAIVEQAVVGPLNDPLGADEYVLTVLRKPGVMDPTAQSVLEMARALNVAVDAVRTYRRYRLGGSYPPAPIGRMVANDAIEQWVVGPLTTDHLGMGRPYQFQRIVVPLRELDEEGLQRLSREGQLALRLEEMRAIQAHFREMGRDPTDIELETIAQTWSEHCSHKTLKGPVDYTDSTGRIRRIRGILRETIFEATRQIRQQLGPNDWCVSVFVDNAGVVRFDDDYHICFKVETHNHPSAIEPYGGANTGLGGVIRDILGTGLGAKPIANTDVFCFAPPDYPVEELPEGVLHPRRVMTGVVQGVRDYGNRMGIPTVNGAVVFDERYLGNPLVYCGTVGLLPVNCVVKKPQAGDLVVAVGGRTGRDGIHGATFSSLELTSRSETESGGAVQIGNPITEKKLLDVLLQARDRGLYRAITDCGAGGFSSAVGEMGAELGASVELSRAPLKYEGLSYTEIWISEAQERMVLAVPPDRWDELRDLCAREDVEAAVLGQFEDTGRLRLSYEGNVVADLAMEFLHRGRPDIVRAAVAPARRSADPSVPVLEPGNYEETLRRVLSSLNVCSKEWIIRQYDHEVQGATVIKPLVGQKDDGPGDAAVLTPVLGSHRGIALGCGIVPRYGDRDAYAMAAAAIDEAVRNVVAVGADPSRVALLDNFCWGNTDRPEVLGALVQAAEACRDIALAFGTPFISGKDSLNNEFRSTSRHIVIPPTLLISALGLVHDVRQCVTADLKEPGNAVYLIGDTRNELGASQWALVAGWQGGNIPQVNRRQAPQLFRTLHRAITQKLVRSCHDLSDGGLGVAIAEMAFAGMVGAELDQLATIPAESDLVRLFSESPSRFLIEVPPTAAPAIESLFEGLPLYRIGRTIAEPVLRVAATSGGWLLAADLADLKSVWRRPLDLVGVTSAKP